MAEEDEASWFDPRGEEIYKTMLDEPGSSDKIDLAEKLFKRAVKERETGHLGAAVFLLRKFIAICKAHFADSVSEAATMFDAAQKFERARELWSDALPLHPPDSPERGDVLQGLARINDRMGEYDLANKQYQEGHSIYEKCYKGPKDHMCSQLLYNWAVSLKRQERLDEALEKFREAGLILKHLRGHAEDRAKNFDNMGEVWQKKGKWQIAENFYREALKEKKRVFGTAHVSYVSTLSKMSTLLHKMGRHQEAQELRKEETKLQELCSREDSIVEKDEAEQRGRSGQEIYELMLRESGDEKHNLAVKLRGEALKLMGSGRSEVACFLMERVMAIRRVIYSASVFNVAVVLYEGGNYKHAVGVWSEALLLHQQDSRERADILQHMAGAHDELGNFDLAKEQYQEAHDIYQKYCKDSRGGEYARLLHNWAVFLKKQEKWHEAYPKLLQAGILWRSTPHHDKDFAKHLHDMGDYWHDMGRWHDAESYYREALETKRSIFGKDHPSYVNTLSNLSALRHEMGGYSEAVELRKEGARIRERCAKDNQLFRALELQNHGSLLHELGQFGSAIECFEEALNIRKTELGQDSLDHAVTLSSLGHAMMDMARYEEAEEMFKKAIAVKHAVVGDNHSSHVTSCINLGHLYHRMGAYKKAMGLFNRARAVSKKIFGEKHPRYTDCLGELASHQAATGKLDEAKNTWEEKLAKDRCFRPDHLCCTVAVIAIAQLCRRSDKPQEARDLLEEQKMKVEQTPGLGRAHPMFANLLSELAMLYDVEPGLGQDAEPLHREAEKTLKAAFGEGHPEHLEALCGLARNACLRDQHDYALQLLEKVHGFKMRMFNAMLPVLPEHRRLLFLECMQEEAQLCPWVALSRQTCSAEVAQQCFGIAAVQKGLIYQVQWAMARASTPSTAGIDREDGHGAAPKGEEGNALRQARLKLVQAVFNSDPCKAEKVETLLEECEVKLGKHLCSSTASPFAHLLGSRGASLLENVANELPERAGLAEYVTCCGPYGADTCYGVFVIPTAANRHLPGGGVQVHLLDLGSAEDLNKRVYELFEVIQELPTSKRWRDLDEEGEVYMPHEREFQKRAAELRREILDPVLAVVGEDLEHLFISPDWELCQLPFEGLPLERNECLHEASGAGGGGGQDATKYIVHEKFTLSYLSSSKDLLPHPHTQKANGSRERECVVFANPDLDFADSTDATPMSNGAAKPKAKREKGEWADLDGTAREGPNVQKVMEGAGYQVKLVEMGGATVEALKSVSRPPVLHVASHGYVIFGETEKQDCLGRLNSPQIKGLNERLEPLENPFFRAGLALAGSRAYQRAVYQGEPLLVEDDSGHITALECCALDLIGTRHVTLSACHTARGDLWSGQGVMSMGRAFQLAGAESVLISLFAVSDEHTPDLMNKFYTFLFGDGNGGIGRAAAFREAQRSLHCEGAPWRTWASLVLHGKPGRL